MKEVKEEVRREVIDTHVYYEAFDGTVFTDKSQCEKYEGSALGVLLQRMHTFAVASDCKDKSINLFSDDEENLYVCVLPKTQDDIDTLNHFWGMRPNTGNKQLPFKPEHLNTLLLIGYRFGDDLQTCLDWCWYYNVNEAMDRMTNGKYKLVEV